MPENPYDQMLKHHITHYKHASRTTTRCVCGFLILLAVSVVAAFHLRIVLQYKSAEKMHQHLTSAHAKAASEWRSQQHLAKRLKQLKKDGALLEPVPIGSFLRVIAESIPSYTLLHTFSYQKHKGDARLTLTGFTVHRYELALWMNTLATRGITHMHLTKNEQLEGGLLFELTCDDQHLVTSYKDDKNPEMPLTRTVR